jgi:hypothetical protein
MIDASSPELINNALKDIGAEAGISDPTPSKTRQWLSSLQDNWLLLFDNADDPSVNLRDFFPQCNHGNIIITTRNPECVTHAVPQGQSTMPPPLNGTRRPALISELAANARKNNWDENGSLQYFLCLAEKDRNDGSDYFDKKDLESSFVSFARPASLILEKIPNHRDFHTTLTRSQRLNLGLVSL